MGTGRGQMTDDPARWLAAQGLDAPGLEPLPLAAGVTTVGFASEGDAALRWWRRLRPVNERTGFWPVLIPSADEAVRASGAVDAGPAERLARAAAPGGVALLHPECTFGRLDERLQQGSAPRV